MKKILFIVIDGLGDEPIPALGGKTPLEAAKKPNLDFLAQRGICGLLRPIYKGAMPTSEEGHFALFGYDPRVYPIKRGIFTAREAGLVMRKGDIALRGNFATVSDDLRVLDRRAGRIKKPTSLLGSLKGIEINGIKFFVARTTGHRLAILMRGKGLSPNISDSDPYYWSLSKKVIGSRPLDKTPEANFTAKTLNKFLAEARDILKKHPFNLQREKIGLAPANYLTTRGASSLVAFPSFKKKYNLEACSLSGNPFYREIAGFLGMKPLTVRGANGTFKTNLKGKFSAARSALGKYDFVFLHLKAADTLAEDGDYQKKKEFIEKIDKNLGWLKKVKTVLVVTTSDHSTSSLLKRHFERSCPVLLFGAGEDGVETFSEKACEGGGLGTIDQSSLMEKIEFYNK